MRGLSDWTRRRARSSFAGVRLVAQPVPVLNGVPRRGRVVRARRGGLGGGRGATGAPRPSTTAPACDARLPREAHAPARRADTGGRRGRARRRASRASALVDAIHVAALFNDDRPARRLVRLARADAARRSRRVRAQARVRLHAADARGRRQPDRDAVPLTPTASIASIAAVRSSQSCAASRPRTGSSRRRIGSDHSREQPGRR